MRDCGIFCVTGTLLTHQDPPSILFFFIMCGWSRGVRLFIATNRNYSLVLCPDLPTELHGNTWKATKKPSALNKRGETSPATSCCAILSGQADRLLCVFYGCSPAEMILQKKIWLLKSLNTHASTCNLRTSNTSPQTQALT